MPAARRATGSRNGTSRPRSSHRCRWPSGAAQPTRGARRTHRCRAGPRARRCGRRPRRQREVLEPARHRAGRSMSQCVRPIAGRLGARPRAGAALRRASARSASRGSGPSAGVVATRRPSRSTVTWSHSSQHLASRCDTKTHRAATGGHPPYGGEDALALDVGERRRRLVEDDQPSSLAQRLRDLDELSLADAERRQQLVRVGCAPAPCRRAPDGTARPPTAAG